MEAIYGMQFVSKRSKPINSFYRILISHSSKWLSQMICHFSTFPLSQQMFVVRFATCMELVLRIAMLKAVMFFSRGVQIGIEYVQSFVISGVRRQSVNYHAVQQSLLGWIGALAWFLWRVATCGHHALDGA